MAFPHRSDRNGTLGTSLGALPVALLWTVLAGATAVPCLAQRLPWRCVDPRISVSLWSAEPVQGTQMRFAPDGTMWVLELRGRLLRLVEAVNGVNATLVYDLREQAQSADAEMGATSFVFDPDFDGVSGTIYLAHNWDALEGRRGGVTRLTIEHLAVTRQALIFGPIASAGAHQVDRLLFDDHDLLLTVGDIWQPFLAQRNDSPHDISPGSKRTSQPVRHRPTDVGRPRRSGGQRSRHGRCPLRAEDRSELRVGSRSRRAARVQLTQMG
jgi:hypothetical protein